MSYQYTVPTATQHTGLKIALVFLILLVIIGTGIAVAVVIYKNKKPAQSPPTSGGNGSPTNGGSVPPPPAANPEVFGTSCGSGYSFGANSSTDAATICTGLGATLASKDQVTAAAQAGANWCSAGWVSDSGPGWPSDGKDKSCGNSGYNALGGNKGCANCYGVKPAKDTTYKDNSGNQWGVLSWNEQDWSRYS